MLTVLNCVLDQHDLWLVLVAGLICVLASLSAVRLFTGLHTARGKVYVAFLVLGALMAGSGIWATHFVAMLAYEPAMRSGYDIAGTAVSFLVAVGWTGIALFLAERARTRLHLALAGGVFGGGVAAMHYIGMLAYRTEGALLWDATLVTASILVGVALGAASFGVLGQQATWKRQIASAGLLTLAICSLHFTGMSAVTIIPSSEISVPPQVISDAILAFLTAGISIVILMGGVSALLIESWSRDSGHARMRRLANAAHEGLLVVQDGFIVDANTAFVALFGAEPGKDIRIADVLHYDTAAMSADRRAEGTLSPCAGAEPIPVEILARQLDTARSPESDATVFAIRDLRERRAAEEQIRYLAEHDSLTRLPNRHALKTRLDATLERVALTGEQVAVFCIDLDNFKEANDVHGHLAGDAVLVETAKRLSAPLTGPSFAARLGGDEFVVVHVVAGHAASEAADFAAGLIDALRQPVGYEKQEISAGGTIGIALFPEDGGEAQTLLANADMALYRAKENGRGSFCFFKRDMDEAIRERRSLAHQLRHAIVQGQLSLHYQPQASAVTGEVCGFEALCRWTTPERGAIPPSEFVTLAEESGLMGMLGEWVLRRGCADAALWPSHLRVAINLSALQLHQRELVGLVHEILIETGLPADRLELEITETALFKDYKRALDTLRRLKALGVRIAMDDFGTGFSSLSTLQSFPFDKIKIDKSFVENINRKERANIIIRAVLGLGRSLEIPVVAEGVETEEQIAFLRDELCAELQGYAIGKPRPLDDAGNPDAERRMPLPVAA